MKSVHYLPISSIGVRRRRTFSRVARATLLYALAFVGGLTTIEFLAAKLGNLFGSLVP